MRPALVMVLGLLPVAAWGQECAQPAYSTDLTAAVGRAEATIAALDIEGFKVATDSLQALIPCLEDPITRSVAAEVHRFLGIRAFFDRETEDAHLMFSAGRALEPAYVFPDDLIPPGNPAREAYEGVTFSDVRYETAGPPLEGTLQFDGRTTNQRPRSWATIHQRFDGSGAIVESVYLMPDQPIPTYPVRVGAPEVIIPYDDPVIETRRPTGLLIATVATGVASGALYGLAGVSEARFKNPNTPDESLDGLANRANALSIAAGIGGAATLGMGIGVAVRW